MQSRHLVFVIAVLFGALVLGAAWSAERFTRSTLAVETADGAVHAFDVELALSAEQRSRGLMFRRSLGANEGMLFDFDRTGRIAMWMKDTLIPLDMLFLAPDGEVLAIAERTEPMSLETISPQVPARAVLEVGAGTVARLGIRRGDMVRHPLFSATPR